MFEIIVIDGYHIIPCLVSKCSSTVSALNQHYVKLDGTMLERHTLSHFTIYCLNYVQYFRVKKYYWYTYHYKLYFFAFHKFHLLLFFNLAVCISRMILIVDIGCIISILLDSSGSVIGLLICSTIVFKYVICG